jgi:hypothetical protein
VQTVKTLLNAGVHVNIQGGRCGTALRIAYKMGHWGIVGMLCAAGAKWSDEDLENEYDLYTNDEDTDEDDISE